MKSVIAPITGNHEPGDNNCLEQDHGNQNEFIYHNFD